MRIRARFHQCLVNGLSRAPPSHDTVRCGPVRCAIEQVGEAACRCRRQPSQSFWNPLSPNYAPLIVSRFGSLGSVAASGAERTFPRQPQPQKLHTHLVSLTYACQQLRPRHPDVVRVLCPSISIASAAIVRAGIACELSSRRANG